jgi:uncharacterized protein YcaQ
MIASRALTSQPTPKLRAAVRRGAPVALGSSAARRIWLRAQRLDEAAPFGGGPQATLKALEHLGYVQIDTINVIERCHHHILFTRIPTYQRADLHRAQTIDKSAFEYWTHALAYVPVRDWPIYQRAMDRDWRRRTRWYQGVTPGEVRKVLKRIEREGPLTIRDIDDDVLAEKEHLWASRKPSKRALQHAFFRGDLVISERRGMLKTYELTDRHFGWDARPRAASEREVATHRLDWALRAQGVVSLESICHGDARRKTAVRRLIEARVRRGALLPASIEGAGRQEHWVSPAAYEALPDVAPDLVHILSPFDPLIIQRKRLELFFGYRHLFEAYVPREKRVLGYFALPVLAGEEIVAAIDVKTDRQQRKVRINRFTWIAPSGRRALKPRIEDALARFERFQLAA